MELTFSITERGMQLYIQYWRWWLAITLHSESYFSSANKILTNKCIKLGASLLEKLMCLKNWIDAEDRIKYDTTLEVTIRAIPTQESDINMINNPKMISTVHVISILKIASYDTWIIITRCSTCFS
jgi:hypothetical protein